MFKSFIFWNPLRASFIWACRLIYVSCVKRNIIIEMKNPLLADNLINHNVVKIFLKCQLKLFFQKFRSHWEFFPKFFSNWLHKSKVGKQIFLFSIFFQPQNQPSSLDGLLWPRRLRKVLIRTFRFLDYPTQNMLKYHWVLTKPHAHFFLSSTSKHHCEFIFYPQTSSHNRSLIVHNVYLWFKIGHG